MEILSDLELPFDLAKLIEWTLKDDLTQRLANASCNDFFDHHEGRIRVSDKCWGILPAEWQAHFEAMCELDPATRDEALEALATGAGSTRTSSRSLKLPAFPASLESFVNTCRSLSFDRTCSFDHPILVYPPTSTSTSTSTSNCARPVKTLLPDSSSPGPTRLNLKGKAKANHANALRAGLSPKKLHEVVQFCALVERMTHDEPLSYCVDVGSGRAHLSRALASRPLDLHVLAVDWSEQQKSGAEKIDELRTRAELNPTVGSLTHRVSALDEPGVRQVLEEWPPLVVVDEPDPDNNNEDNGNGEDDQHERRRGVRRQGRRRRREPALLVALHACGDLTPDAIKAFTEFSSSSSSSSCELLTTTPRAVFVGCCYNLQTPSRFPLSRSVETVIAAAATDLRPPTMTLAHLRLTPQSPPTWHATGTTTSAFRSATLKLAHRARLEAELAANGFGTDVGERKVGRVPECRTWGAYRTKAVERIASRSTESSERGWREVPFDGGDEDGWDRAVFLLRVWWTIRSWLGPPLESLVVLDRYLLLVEGLHPEPRVAETPELPTRRVEMMNIFDQATGSLRNIALVVR